MNKFSAEWVKKQVVDNRYQSLDHHTCSMCGYMVNFRFSGDIVTFDPGCFCSWGSQRPASFSEISEWFHMQDNDTVREVIAKGFRT